MTIKIKILAAATLLMPFTYSKADYHFIDRTGKTVIAGPFQKAGDFSEGLAIVVRGDDGKPEFIDKTGKTVFKLDFELDTAPLSLPTFQNGLVLVPEKGADPFSKIFHYVDKTGKEIFACAGAEARPFRGGVCLIRTNKPKALPTWTAYNAQGKTLASLAESSEFAYGDGLVPFMKDGKIGFCDPTGAEVLKPVYSETYGFNGGFGVVSNGEEWAVIDRTGKMLFQTEHEATSWVSEGFLPVIKLGKNDEEIAVFLDMSGKELAYAPAAKPAIIMTAFSQGLAWVEDQNASSALVDTTGKLLTKFAYTEMKEPSDGLIHVLDKKGKAGFIDLQGKVVIPFKYDDADSFSEGLAAVFTNVDGGYIDKTGKIVIPMKYSAVHPFKEGVASVSEWPQP